MTSPNDGWRPFEPCRENVRASIDTVSALLARELEALKEQAPKFPPLVYKRLLPLDPIYSYFGPRRVIGGVRGDRHVIAFRVPSRGSEGGWLLDMATRIRANHDAGDEDRS